MVCSPLSFHTQDNSPKLPPASQRTMSSSVFSVASPLSLVETDTCLWGCMGGSSPGAGVALKAADTPLSWPDITVANTFASYCRSTPPHSVIKSCPLFISVLTDMSMTTSRREDFSFSLPASSCHPQRDAARNLQWTSIHSDF